MVPRKKGQAGMADYEERLSFETLLADLSSHFINLPSEQVDDAIENAQRRVCECLGLDLSVLWQWEGEEAGTLVLTHYYRRLDGPPVERRMKASEHFPWALGEMMAGRIFCITSMDKVPAGGGRDVMSWRHFGLKNVVSFPLFAGGGVAFGAISFHDMVTPRTWSEPLIKRLELVAEVFANALERKRSEQALRESEARLIMAADSAGVGLWSLDLASGRYWLTDKARNALGFKADENVTFDRVLEAVHPEDRDKVRHVAQSVVASKQEGHVEYRVGDAGGRLRWLVSRGRVQCGPDGKPDRLMGVTLDITERKHREEAFRISTARVAAAVEIAELGFYQLDAHNRVAFLDERFRAMLGMTPETTGTESEFWLAHIHPEDQARLMQASRDLLEAGQERVEMEYRYALPSGEVKWLHHLANVLERNSAGRATCVVGVVLDITERKRVELDLRQALDQVQRLRDQLQNENVYLRQQVLTEAGHGTIVGESEAVKKMLALARKVAPMDSAVLITGETGTGKEILAQAIHEMSCRKAKTMVKVNCAALPAPLIESELFGREKGAYTGAMTQQVGRFELANDSTIFLDEIGDLPLDLQTKLLRILQDGQFERLGSNRTLKTDVRVIAATNRNLSAMIIEGKFREDLFHRLNVFPIEVPPLRARISDIPLLVWKIVQEFNVKMGRSIDSIPKATMEQLKQFPWPGNVRELRNVIERAMIVSEGRSLKVELQKAGIFSSPQPSTLEELERQHILDVLERTHWRISGKGGSAEILGLVPTTLHSRMKKLKISRPTR